MPQALHSVSTIENWTNRWVITVLNTNILFQINLLDIAHLFLHGRTPNQYDFAAHAWIIHFFCMCGWFQSRLRAKTVSWFTIQSIICIFPHSTSDDIRIQSEFDTKYFINKFHWIICILNLAWYWWIVDEVSFQVYRIHFT